MCRPRPRNFVSIYSITLYLRHFMCFNAGFNAINMAAIYSLTAELWSEPGASLPVTSPRNADTLNLRHGRTARQQSTQTVMTEGDIIGPIKGSKAISDTRRRLQTLHSVHSCSVGPIQDSQSGGNDNQIKHKGQNMRKTGLEKKHNNAERKGIN